ncbi:MAG TPA: aldo/keto reductase [Stellaceae bacterium]|nr:aldo/keto reductase [Stellaceae bacterium]
MQLRNLGKSGLRISLIGLGCNNLGGRIDLAASRRVVHRALDLGITTFDTADSYGNVHGHIGGSETALGQILGDRRKGMVPATKFGMAMNEEGNLQGGSGGGEDQRRPAVIDQAVIEKVQRLADVAGAVVPCRVERFAHDRLRVQPGMPPERDRDRAELIGSSAMGNACARARTSSCLSTRSR